MQIVHKLQCLGILLLQKFDEIMKQIHLVVCCLGVDQLIAFTTQNTNSQQLKSFQSYSTIQIYMERKKIGSITAVNRSTPNLGERVEFEAIGATARRAAIQVIAQRQHAGQNQLQSLAATNT